MIATVTVYALIVFGPNYVIADYPTVEDCKLSYDAIVAFADDGIGPKPTGYACIGHRKAVVVNP